MCLDGGVLLWALSRQQFVLGAGPAELELPGKRALTRAAKALWKPARKAWCGSVRGHESALDLHRRAQTARQGNKTAPTRFHVLFTGPWTLARP